MALSSEACITGMGILCLMGDAAAESTHENYTVNNTKPFSIPLAFVIAADCEPRHASCV